MNSNFELADVIRHHLPSMDIKSMPMDHYRILDAISKCRTIALGGHIDSCDDCGHLRISYNSCRNRHCPKCQGLNKEMWIIMQEDMLLPVVYYHVVFTLPQELNILCRFNPHQMYDLLFNSAWHVLNSFASDPKWVGAKTSATMLLHTWSQTLALHPHLHCIVPNGGLDQDDHWKFPRKGHNNFLFPVAAMKKVFRGYFMQQLLKIVKLQSIFIPKHYFQKYGSIENWRKLLFSKDWVVYTKKPFSGPHKVIKYVGRYSNKVAITNTRIIHLNKQENLVTFSYKDYKDKGREKIMTFTTHEFVRRFTLHILPKRYRKIRHYGLSSNSCKAKKINQARVSLGLKVKKLMDRAARNKLAKKRLNIDFQHCPICKAKMKTILLFTASRPPPPHMFNNKNK